MENIDDRASLLIVDDERGPTESLRMIFKPQYEVFTAPGGQTRPCEILHSTPIDVVTLDLRMPGMPGVEVMEHIKRHDPDIEVIVVTGYASLDSAIRGLRHRVFDYVTKPFDVPQISRPGAARRGAAARRSAGAAHQGRLPGQPVARAAHASQRHHRLQLHPHRGAAPPPQRGSARRLRPHPGELAAAAQPDRNRAAAQLARRRRARAQRLDASTCARSCGARRAISPPPPASRGLDPGGRGRRRARSGCTSDEHKLERILWALIDNAMKFTPARLDLACRRSHGRRQLVRDRRPRHRRRHRADSVEDLIERAAHSAVEPADRVPGLGLGLRMATRLTEFLGGHLRVRSASGAGTQFTIALPVFAPATARACSTRSVPMANDFLLCRPLRRTLSPSPLRPAGGIDRGTQERDLDLDDFLAGHEATPWSTRRAAPSRAVHDRPVWDPMATSLVPRPYGQRRVASLCAAGGRSSTSAPLRVGHLQRGAQLRGVVLRRSGRAASAPGARPPFLSRWPCASTKLESVRRRRAATWSGARPGDHRDELRRRRATRTPASRPFPTRLCGPAAVALHLHLRRLRAGPRRAPS